MEHFDIIHNCPSNIYSHALPFSPPSSWLHKYYTAELSQEVRVVKGVPAEWGACSRTISCGDIPSSLAYQEGLLATGLLSGRIVTLNAITGSKAAILTGHTDSVRSLAFSLDGIFLVSGGDDNTVKLWDVQTGGVVKTFYGHTSYVLSVSISPDCTTIASGSGDKTIHLWHVQAGDCFCVIDGFDGQVNSVSFSPTNPQLLISVSDDNTVQLWNIDGCQIGPTHDGKGVAFSFDGTHFISWGEQVATVQESYSRVVVAELQVSGDDLECCCFSSNNKFVAGGAGCTVYIWSIAGSDPYLVETLTGHSDIITSLIFPSSIISASSDQTVKFWQMGTTDPVATDRRSTLPTPSSIESVSLQGKNGVSISSDFTGVVKIWDILTGLCKESFQTPAKGRTWRDAQLIEGKLIIVWCEDKKIHIWDANQSKILKMVQIPGYGVSGLRISGDGSKIFCLIGRFLQAWAMWTGEAVGRVELDGDPYLDPLCTDGSKIWVCFKDSPAQGWDFGISDSPPCLLSNTSLDRPHLNFIGGTREWDTGPSMVKDAVTGKVVFRLVGRYARPTGVQWDGRYLVVGYRSGEVLNLDFNRVLLQ